MSKLWLLVSCVLIAVRLYPSFGNNTLLVTRNKIEKMESDFFVKYEERLKDGDDFLIKIVFFEKKKNNYYGKQMQYVTSQRLYYHHKDGLDIKNPKEAFEQLQNKFNK